MYLLTLRDGLQTRHIGPYPSPARAAEDVEQLLQLFGERAHWQIHQLEAPHDLLHPALLEHEPHKDVAAA
ncbi:MAG: hypothetical protein VKI83_00275 [Synechococcaceae cyanobacterium]|nr:hypothetical protein [Synechococcaceae cyanobacterium]